MAESSKNRSEAERAHYKMLESEAPNILYQMHSKPIQDPNVAARLELSKGAIEEHYKNLQYRVPDYFPPNWLNPVIGRFCNELTEKSLTKSDVKVDRDTLTLPNTFYNSILKPLLEQRERSIANEGRGGGLDVAVFDWRAKVYPTKFKRIGSIKKTNVLISGWSQLLRENNLKESDILMMWVFRHRETNGICAFVKKNYGQMVGY